MGKNRNRQTQSVEGHARDREVRNDLVPEVGHRIRGAIAVWVVHLRRDRKRTKVTLGSAVTIPIDRARALARGLLKAPSDARHPASLGTVVKFAETFLEVCASQWKPLTLATNRRFMEQHILPKFEKRPFADFTRENVIAWMNDAKASSGARNRAMPVLSSVMMHAEILRFAAPRFKHFSKAAAAENHVGGGLS